jgi:hypothetical protein
VAVGSIYRKLGWMAIEEGQWQTAEELYMISLEYAPNHPVALQKLDFIDQERTDR